MDTSTSDRPSVNISELMPFIESTQASGALSLSDAFVVFSAVRFLTEGTDEQRDEFLSQVPEPQRKGSANDLATQVVVGTIVRGQAKGAFSLADAAKLAKLLHLVKT